MTESLRIAVLLCLAAGIGTTLLLSSLPAFSRLSTAQRLAPYATGAQRQPHNSVNGAVVALLGLTTEWLERILAILGVRSSLATRLQRAGSDLDPSALRLKQVALSSAGLVTSVTLVAAISPPLLVGGLLILGAVLLPVLVIEQNVTNLVTARRNRILAELPTFAEQLATLLSAGFSLGSAIEQISTRNKGELGQAMSQVRSRIHHGLSTTAALSEWAREIDIAEVRRLVSVLELSNETSDLGTLVGNEADAVRKDAHRRLLSHIETRAQQVWIPVTVATLVPGIIFLLVPFLQALSLFYAT